MNTLKPDITDVEFDALYPEKVRLLAVKHWTPVNVARLAAQYLVERPGTRVLDIGSGAGKFCLIGALHTQGHFTGVEQRADLVQIANQIAALNWVPNVSFRCGNVSAISFRDFESFYFYNSFEENLDTENKIDDSLRVSPELYHSYSTYVCAQLALTPLGTKVVTYHSPFDIVPGNFRLQHSLLEGALKFWERAEITTEE